MNRYERVKKKKKPNPVSTLFILDLSAIDQSHYLILYRYIAYPYSPHTINYNIIATIIKTLDCRMFNEKCDVKARNRLYYLGVYNNNVLSTPLSSKQCMQCKQSKQCKLLL